MKNKNYILLKSSKIDAFKSSNYYNKNLKEYFNNIIIKLISIFNFKNKFYIIFY